MYTFFAAEEAITMHRARADVRIKCLSIDASVVIWGNTRSFLIIRDFVQQSLGHSANQIEEHFY